VADARVIDIPGDSYPNANYEKDFLSVYTAPGNVQRTFMRFDFSGIAFPPGQQVSSAILRLNATTGFGVSRGLPTEVYRVTQPWTEKGLTWRVRDTGVPWAAPGGDYAGRGGAPDHDPYASNSQVVSSPAPVAWDLTILVAEWLEGIAANDGLLLRSYAGNGLTFPSRENSNAGVRPRLEVTISPGPPLLRIDSFSGGQLMLSWRGGADTAMLEENDSLTGSGWNPSSLAVTIAEGRSRVTLGASPGRKFLRLRSVE
jgi:hypothetical protein